MSTKRATSPSRRATLARGFLPPYPSSVILNPVISRPSTKRSTPKVYTNSPKRSASPKRAASPSRRASAVRGFGPLSPGPKAPVAIQPPPGSHGGGKPLGRSGKSPSRRASAVRGSRVRHSRAKIYRRDRK